MKMAILYFSKTGNTEKMAQYIAEGAACVAGVEVRAFPTGGEDMDFVRESSCVIFGTPTYYASEAGEMKNWLDGPCGRLALAGKLCGAFATQNYMHGGADLAMQSILTQVMVRGALVYSGGGACGKPVIHLGPAALAGRLEESGEIFRIYGRRMAEKAAELFA